MFKRNRIFCNSALIVKRKSKSRSKKMKKCISLFSLFSASVAMAAQVDRVLVRQQWPWNTGVRVEYVVSGLSAPAAVSFRFFDDGKEIPVSDTKALKGDAAYAKNGTNVATFNPRELFGPAASSEYSSFTVKVVLGAEDASMGDKLYRIIDLDTGKVEDVMRADFYNGKYGAFETSYQAINSTFTEPSDIDVFIWTDVTNNPVYRTSKMVLRKIIAADKEWIMGANIEGVGLELPSSPHLVKLTSNYYIGVFPVTQAQYFKLKGGMGSKFTDDEAYPGHEGYPVYGISYNTWRGRDKYWTEDGSDVQEDSYLDILRKKCGGTILFDMPTEAQWEFAFRGGIYDTVMYSGKGYGQNSLKELGWCVDNSRVPEDGATQPHVVGLKYPNAYGLYDMAGNMCEWCVDWSDGQDFAWKSQTEPEVDPQGVPKSQITLDKYGSGSHILRGGAFNQERKYLHAGYRDGDIGSSTGKNCIRVYCPAE